MAQQIRLIKLTWENEVIFKMETKLDNASYVTVMEMDENGCLAHLWPSAKQLCEKFFEKSLDTIGTEMKA